MSIEEECLMDDPNIEIKYEDEQHFDDAFKNSGEEGQAEDDEEDDEENEGIAETKPKNKKVDLEEEFEMTDLETDKKKKKSKFLIDFLKELCLIINFEIR